MKYPGGKGGAGVYQAIINQIPPHRVYFEPFVGGGNVFERKAPAASSVLMDADPHVVALWRERMRDRPDVTVLQGDALELLERKADGLVWPDDEFVYLDPPYVHATRKGGALYRVEMSDDDHARLLAVLAKLRVPFALSGYRGELYDEAASRCGWRRIDFKAMTRRGPVVESLWMNYPAPAALADYSHVGRDYRERERIKRKVHRWVSRWQQLPANERNAIKAAMVDVESGDEIAPPVAPVATSTPATPARVPGSSLQLPMEYSA